MCELPRRQWYCYKTQLAIIIGFGLSVSSFLCVLNLFQILFPLNENSDTAFKYKIALHTLKTTIIIIIIFILILSSRFETHTKRIHVFFTRYASHYDETYVIMIIVFFLFLLWRFTKPCCSSSITKRIQFSRKMEKEKLQLVHETTRAVV